MFACKELCTHDKIPHAKAIDEDEERRLFYVAVTRAKRCVTMVAESGRTARTIRVPSPYVGEIAQRVEGVQVWDGRRDNKLAEGGKHAD